MAGSVSHKVDGEHCVLGKIQHQFLRHNLGKKLIFISLLLLDLKKRKSWVQSYKIVDHRQVF